MTRWWLFAALVIPGGLIAIAALEVWRRHQEDFDADYVRRVRTWYERAPVGTEPTIKPLALPKVKPLKARREREEMPMDNLREFGRRPGKRA